MLTLQLYSLFVIRHDQMFFFEYLLHSKGKAYEIILDIFIICTSTQKSLDVII